MNAHRSDSRAIAGVEFAQQMGAKVNGDGVSTSGFERNDLSGEGSSDVTRLIAPMDSSTWVGAFQLAVGRVRPALQLYRTRTRTIIAATRMHP